MTKQQAHGRKSCLKELKNMSRIHRVAIIITAAALLLVVSGGCSLKKTVINSTGLFMDDVVDEFLAESDLEFARQAGPANLKLLDGLIKGSNYENDGLLIKGCKLYGMYAMAFFEDDGQDKKTEKTNMKRASNFYKRAMDYGMKVMLKNPDFKAAAAGSLDDFVKVMPAFGKSDIDALFWTAFAWGSYINLNRNSAAEVADLPKVIAMINRVIEIDTGYFYGIPHLFLIVSYSMPAMFGGDLEKAKAEYQKIRDISGAKFIIADFFMAKFYAVQAQNKELFEQLLKGIQTADDDLIPERMFTQVAKKKAEFLLLKENDIF
jgi:hypothetical protein